jgi:ABC-2 type transport system ATP-binding protein
MNLEVSGLTKRYGTQVAVNNIGFGMETGQIVGFLGPNGAGKSTTMKMLTGFLEPDAGTIKLGDLTHENDSLALRRRIGYLPEHNPLYLDMYVHESLRFTGNLYGLRGKVLSARIDELVELVGLTREQHKRLGQLSKGYRQRVGLAQALIHDPELLVLDEPTSGLDPNQVMEIRDVIRRAGQRKMVLFSSHILSEVEAVADRVIIIHHGNLLADDRMSLLQQRLGARRKVRLEVEAAGLNTKSLEALPLVESVRKVNATTFELTPAPGADIRKAVTEAVLAQEHQLLTLAQVDMKLEDIFRQLTQAKA